MTDLDQDFQADYIDLTADIVAAYVSNNSVPASALGELLHNVYAAVCGLAASGVGASVADVVEKATPAEIKKSITHDALISFEDGKPYKTLRRHLGLRGLSAEAYRAKHGLPPDYPMTSASYSAQRSELAKSLGLGLQRNSAAKAVAVSKVGSKVSTSETPKNGVGRPRKVVATE